MTKPMPAHRILPVPTILLLFTIGAFSIGAASIEAWGQSDSAPPSSALPTAATGKQANQQSDDKAQPGSRAAHSDNSYVIGADDVLAINVWKEPEVSRSVTVRSDGKISLPLVGELMAGGETPLQLEQEIAKRLASYISEPEVTVIVQDSKSQRINILGMVVRPGAYLLTGSATTVLDAIAMAGGFRDFAKQKAIYVLRQNPDGTQKRLPFNYQEVIKGHDPDQNVRLLPRDTVVVP